MTLWQDQTPRQPGTGTAHGPAGGAATADPNRPLSRREARERERLAAEALADGQEHPSGVVDFGGFDFDPDFHPEQGFGQQDTADIWAALSRRSQQPPAAPQQPAQPHADSALPPVTDDLMDRVRGAVLRREREVQAEPPTAIAPVQRHSPLDPAAQPPLPSRRAARREEAARTTEDGMPAAWFSDRSAPQPDDDLPPTVAMRMPAVDRADLEARAPLTAPVGLPRAFVAPVGDDAVSFSSLAPAAAPLAHPAVDPALAEPAFVEPEQPWAQRHQAWSAEPQDEWQTAQPWNEPARQTSPGHSAQPWNDVQDDEDWNEPTTATPWSELQQQAPQPAWSDQQPYSEPTDLAGFEALIKKARGAQPPQPQPQAQAGPAPMPPWQEPEAPEQSPFARAVSAPHGSSNALVLGQDPTPDLTQAVNSTGDIFITGSMKLPRSLSTTGATEEHYDGPDVDRLYDAAHHEPAAGVAPVRASRAVAGTPTGRPLVGRRSKSNVLPTVLAVVAGAMAVGVLVLLVGSWVLHLF